ncbi:hypothetical protein [Paraburkholderia acidisoli]|uniref:Uncharacterized protein n=1 Tax=Paraburkholderia acidisoli TaxID=2571748 RepID=A0A7Z2GQT2_9BURK|nr:hypothetical protein [Paraburkholderia acidisoli]QGZ66271.1 hypothetical protein FAZ98_31210 [Paraburkholderia acidisoli]
MASLDENFNVVFPVVTDRVTRKEKDKVTGEEKDVHENIVRVHAFHTPHQQGCV